MSTSRLKYAKAKFFVLTQGFELQISVAHMKNPFLIQVKVYKGVNYVHQMSIQFTVREYKSKIIALIQYDVIAAGTSA